MLMFSYPFILAHTPNKFAYLLRLSLFDYKWSVNRTEIYIALFIAFIKK